MRRAITVEQLMNKKFDIMQFTDKWEASFGQPEATGVWIVWGNSGNGKTRFAVKLAKYLASFSRVAYNTLEEGARRSMKRVVIDERMIDVKKRFIILHREPIEELKQRLRKRKSPDIIIVDSFQYTGLTKQQYIDLKEEFDNKLFIFLSHAEGKNPEGRTAKFVRYDADIKIRIEGYTAFPVSRYGGGEPFIIWDQGAAIYWKDTDN